MNYYKRHIGDYMKDASHLSLLEHGIYMRLMDVYYTRESAIPVDQAARLIGARSKDEKEALAVVVAEFFQEVDGFYKQTRCDIEIALMQQKAETNRDVGKRGGRPKKETAKVQSGNPEITQTVSENNPDVTLATSHKPLANSSVPIGTGGKPPITDPDEIIFGYGLPMLTNAGTPEKQARSFLGGLRKHHGDAALVNKLRECARAKPLQPLEWLAAALPPAGVAPKLNSQEALEASNRAVAERFLAGEAAHEAV